MTTDETNNPNPQQTQPNPYYFQNNGNQVAPNSLPVLILGILSIAFCWCYGIISVVLAIIAIIMANAGEKEYNLNPHAYSMASYKNLKAGKTCAIIGLCLSGVALICLILYVILVGSLAFNLMNFGSH